MRTLNLLMFLSLIISNLLVTACADEPKKIASTQGCSEDDLNDSTTAFLRCDSGVAFKHAIEQAKKGNARSLYALGLIYDYGGHSYGLPDVKPDRPLAEKYYLESAKRGNEDAQFRIGFIYLRRHETEGKYWLCKAALQGQSDAIVNMNNLVKYGDINASSWNDYCLVLIKETENSNAQQ